MTNRAKMLAVIGLALLVGTVTVWAQMGGPGMGPGSQPGGMMGSGNCPGMGPGPMGGRGPGVPVTTIDQAATIAQNYLRTWNNPDLVLWEVMEFANHFYVAVREKSTGTGALELLVERFNGQVHFEPTMKWNTKYAQQMGGQGPQGGPMGPPRGSASSPMSITPEQARQTAQQFLTLYYPGAALDKEIKAFYGYYTIDLLRDGKPFGMLSVNGYTGQVWYHQWHGSFFGAQEF